MSDLVCLVADKNMEATIQAVLRRPEALGILPIDPVILVHPRRDPGCFHDAAGLLRGYRERSSHALVLLDRAWAGAPADTGAGLERTVREKLEPDFGSDWADAIVIDPELEAWVFSDSPHVAEALGWASKTPVLRAALQARGLWTANAPKPADPKSAVEWALREAKRPRSSSMYRALAQKVSFDRCQDRSFLRLKELLGRWFPKP